MSCCEHVCLECGWMALDNNAGPLSCPECGGRVVTYFDEPPDRHDSDDSPTWEEGDYAWEEEEKS